MDPITHAASGAILAYALPKAQRPQSKIFVLLGALMAASPDIDVFFATPPINYILLHRGITHSLAAIPFLALLFTLLAYPLWKKRKGQAEDASSVASSVEPSVEPSAKPFAEFSTASSTAFSVFSGFTQTRWTFTKHFAFACICLLLHLWLDVITTYGTMIFLPFSEYRVRLNGVFIVDILLTLPLLLAVWHGASYRPYAIMALVWLCVYPAACVGLRWHHEKRLEAVFSQETLAQEQGALVDIMVFPDALAPLNWRVVYETDKPYEKRQASAYTWSQEKSRTGYYFPASAHTVYQRGFTAWGAWRSPTLAYAALDAEVAQSLRAQSRRGRAFVDFLVMPIAERKSMTLPEQSQWGIYDLRFSTLVKSIHEMLALRNDGQPTFLLEAKRAEGADAVQKNENQPWQEVRLLLAGAGQDSGWQKPEAPQNSTEQAWWKKIVGIPY